jgi:AcrR family transcriptional regulator
MTTLDLAPHVLAAAARLLAEGEDALTMSRLAAEAGLSRATLYRAVGGREAILDALEATGHDVGVRAGARERILAGAREVFGRAGFDAATVEEIAAAAGVGVATVYRHFGDKDGLVAAFLDHVAPRRAVRAAQRSFTGDLRRDLESVAAQVLAAMRDDAPVVRVMLLEALREGPAITTARAAQSRSMEAIAALLREHAAAGELRDLDPGVLAQSFAGMLFAFGVLGPVMRGAPAPDPDATARTLTGVFLDGVRATAERSEP